MMHTVQNMAQAHPT